MYIILKKIFVPETQKLLSGGGLNNFPDNLDFKGKIVAKFLVSHFLSIWNNDNKAVK